MGLSVRGGPRSGVRRKRAPSDRQKEKRKKVAT